MSKFKYLVNFAQQKSNIKIYEEFYLCVLLPVFLTSLRDKRRKKNEKNQTTCLLKVKYIAMKPENPKHFLLS